MRLILYSQPLNRRTVAVIQQHIVERGKRTIFHRFFRAKGDEKLVATWKLDLVEIRRVFDVRCVPSLASHSGELSHFHFQTELATGTDTGIPDADHGVSNINATVSEVRDEPVDPPTTTSSIDRNTLETREDEDERFRAVSNTCTLPITE